jgi:replicative DNA helicase
MLQYTELFEPRDFFYFQGTFEAIRKAIAEGKPVTIATVHGEYTVTNLADYMRKAIPNQIEFFVEQMKEVVAGDRLSGILMTKPTGSPFEQAAELIEELKEILPTGKSKDMNQLLLNMIAEIDERKENKKVLTYGIPTLDRRTNGIHKQNLVIVAGRPGIGKSAFALQVASHVCEKSAKVLFVSLEMGETELLERLAMHLSDIDTYNMKTGNLTKFEWNQLSVATDRISAYKLDINTHIRTPAQLRVEIARTQPDLVIVDQLGLLRDENRVNSRREEIVNITRKLKLMAMDFDIPIMALAQINRDANETIPTLANLKESGSIEEDANVVIMLHALSRQQCENKNIPWFEMDSGRKSLLVMLAKHRAGEVGNIPAVFIGRKYKFMEVQR